MRTSFSAMLVLSVSLAGCGVGGRGPETVACTRGLPVQVACGFDGLGSCDGDPILAVCDGAQGAADACVGPGSPGFLGENDDALRGNACPSVTVICPSSGSLGVRPRGVESTRSYDPNITNCNWATRIPGV